MSASALEQRIKTQSEGIFSRFCSTLAKVNFGAAVAVPLAVGLGVFLTGIGMEAHGQSALGASQGWEAVHAYKAALQANPISLAEAVVQGFKGDSPAFGGNAQGMGMGIIAVAPALSALSVALSRGFVMIKDALKARSEEASVYQKQQQTASSTLRDGLDRIASTLDAASQVQVAPTIKHRGLG